jgi:hypothetical protein
MYTKVRITNLVLTSRRFPTISSTARHTILFGVRDRESQVSWQLSENLAPSLSTERRWTDELTFLSTNNLLSCHKLRNLFIILNRPSSCHTSLSHCLEHSFHPQIYTRSCFVSLFLHKLLIRLSQNSHFVRHKQITVLITCKSISNSGSYTARNRAHKAMAFGLVRRLDHKFAVVRGLNRNPRDRSSLWRPLEVCPWFWSLLVSLGYSRCSGGHSQFWRSKVKCDRS